MSLKKAASTFLDKLNESAFGDEETILDFDLTIKKEKS